MGKGNYAGNTNERARVARGAGVHYQSERNPNPRHWEVYSKSILG